VSWHWDDGANAENVGATSPVVSWATDDLLATDLVGAVQEGFLHERVVATATTAFRAHRVMLATRDELDLDLALLSLVYDSHQAAQPAGVRDRAGGTSRTLVFESDDLGVEVEVEPDVIEGQLIPPRAGRVSLLSPGSTVATTETDEVGYFRFEVHPGGPLRLECSSDGGACVTEWLPW
jgi:hypothetical protein